MAQTGAKPKPIGRKLRILIADDHADIRKMVRAILEQHARFEIVGEAVNGAKAIEEARRLEPDVVVINVNMPVLNGLEAAREIKTKLPHSAIVMLSLNADERFFEEARKVGASAYVSKSRAAETLISAIETATAGGDFLLMA